MIINSREGLLSDRVLLLIIGVLFKLSDVSTDTVVSKECAKNNDCFLPISKCNRNLGLCQCRNGYPIVLSAFGSCLDYTLVGKYCINSVQCSQTANAFCLNEESVELKKIDLIDGRLLTEYYIRSSHSNKKAKYNKYRSVANGYKSLGKCKCRTGYNKINEKLCQKLAPSNRICDGSYECLQTDLNSHCDAKSDRCVCDAGYIYDSDRNECRITSKKYSDSCNHDFECQNWDPNMQCSYSLCVCQQSYDFDLNTQRCKQLDTRESKSKVCNYGFKWNENTEECQALALYDVRQSEYRFFSIDKLLETIVIVIFCCVTIALLRFWRNIIPQHIYNDSRTGVFSDSTHLNRVNRAQRRRSSRITALSRSERTIQLRVNLESTDSQYLSDQTFVDLPLTASHSSLPPYELASSSLSNDSQPPPYTDGPPTYEEAMALSQNNEEIKSENK